MGRGWWALSPMMMLGCGLDLPEEGVLDRTRILAARAEPAQPSPGVPFTVTSYAYAPSGAPRVVWCLPTGTCDPESALAEALAGLDWEALSETERAERRTEALEAAIVGVEPGMPVVAQLPPEGPITLFAYGVPPEGDDIEVATWTLDPTVMPMNTHPEIAAVWLDGVPVDAVDAEPEVPGTWELVLTDDALQDGESASVQWYTDIVGAVLGGGFGPGGGGGGGPAFLDDGTFELTVPQGASGIVVAVVRDGRGGTDWVEVPVTAP